MPPLVHGVEHKCTRSRVVTSLTNRPQSNYVYDSPREAVIIEPSRDEKPIVCVLQSEPSLLCLDGCCTDPELVRPRNVVGGKT